MKSVLPVFVFASLTLVSTAAFAADAPKTTDKEKAGQTTLTSSATAEDGLPPAPLPQPKDDPAAGKNERTDAHLRGLEITVRPAFGGAPSGSPVQVQNNGRFRGDAGSLLNGTATPYGTGFVGQAMLGYRFHPIVSGGLRGGFRNASASGLSDGSTGLSRSSWDAGFYVRAYPLALNEKVRKYVDPWASVGVEYMRDLQTFKRDIPTSGGGNVNANWTIDHHAVAVPLAVGIDYRVLPMLSVGPSFEYTIASPIAGCMRSEATGFQPVAYCSNESPGSNFVHADSYGVWTAALDVKLTVF